MKKGCLVSIVTVILLVGIVVGGAALLLGTTSNVDVKWTENNYSAGLEKTKIKFANIEDINVLNLIGNNFGTKGTNRIDTSFSSEEVSSLVTKANLNNGPIKDVRIKLLSNNELEQSYTLSGSAVDFIKNSGLLKKVSLKSGGIFALLAPVAASLTDFLVDFLTNAVNNKPIYAKGRLERTSTNSIDLQIETIKIGQVPLPMNAVKQVEQYTINIVNTLISKENGFSIEELRIEDGQLYYRGTLPAEITGKEIK